MRGQHRLYSPSSTTPSEMSASWFGGSVTVESFSALVQESGGGGDDGGEVGIIIGASALAAVALSWKRAAKTAQRSRPRPRQRLPPNNSFKGLPDPLPPWHEPS